VRDFDVVNVSAQNEDLPVNRIYLVDPTSVDTSLVRGVHDIEVVEDLVDVLFPQSTGFGLSLSTGNTNGPSFPWRELSSSNRTYTDWVGGGALE
jgi:hypothetical protein